MSWWNQYIELPYLEKGRDRQGVDCWGLVRLVQKEQFGRDLPSYDEDYSTVADQDRLEELFQHHRGSWDLVSKAQAGDLVLFRILGVESHIGVMCDEDRFLHIRQGINASVENLSASRWASRIAGLHRFRAVSDLVTVAAAPDPLKLVSKVVSFGPGQSISEILEVVRRQESVSDAVPWDAHVWVNGRAVDKEVWPNYCPAPGSRVDIRVVPRGDLGRLIATLAIVAFAAYAAPTLAGLTGLTGAPLAGATAAIQAGLTFAGSLLVNAIFPVRPPTQPAFVQGERQNLLSGANNQANPYGAIPVVLGRIRSIPPLAAQTYAEYGPSESYLRLLLCWSYGPAQVTDIKIGTNSLNSLEEVEIYTLEGRTGESTTDLERVYATDISQVIPQAELECFEKALVSLNVTSNVLTVVTKTNHEFSSGWGIGITGLFVNGTISSIVNPTTFTVAYTAPNGAIAITNRVASGSPWVEQVVGGEINKLRVDLHFPEGMQRINLEGKDAGPTSTTARFTAQIRRLDSLTLAPLTPWSNIDTLIAAKSFSLGTAFYNLIAGPFGQQQVSAVYQWSRVFVDRVGNLTIQSGSVSESQNADASPALQQVLQGERWGDFVINAQQYVRLPVPPAGSFTLFEVCVFGDTVVKTNDYRSANSVVGCVPTLVGRSLSFTDGSVVRAQSETVILGDKGEPYHKAKDAFTFSLSVDLVPGRYEVRVRRNNSSLRNGAYPSGNKFTNYFTGILQAVTGFSNGRPFTPPFPMAVTAIRVKASGQINGQLPPISGIVQCICKDWDGTGWVERATRNPASLFRHVLQHPANAQRVPDDMLNLAEIQDFHEFCRVNSFTFDRNLLEVTSLEEVLDDICAAGRASKIRKDGKWTVVIDRPRTQVSQFFTPHNSWGFSGSRAIPRIPHAFRVQFVNSERGFQPDELVVYDDGYNATNATLFEALELPGVTQSSVIYKHARFHLAQVKLRPEVYSLNVDIEHLICNRGDLVRVVHDVPLWGIGSARIRNWLNSTNIQLDEAILLEANTDYTIRIRQQNGSSLTRNVVRKTTKDYYSTLTLTQALTATEGEAGLLVMLGKLDQESVELIVLGIEPAENLTALLTLVDYSPAVYESDTQPIPAFDSKITAAIGYEIREIGEGFKITSLRSDESVIRVLPNGTFDYGLRVSYILPPMPNVQFRGVQAELDFANDGKEFWSDSQEVSPDKQAISFYGLQQGEEYRVRLRALAEDGRVGPWLVSEPHQVVGKLSPPLPVSGFSAVVESKAIRLSWVENVELDVAGYEIRLVDSGWGTESQALFSGTANTTLVSAVGQPTTFYIRARDTGGRFSLTSSSVIFNPEAVPNVPDITHTFATTSLTNASVTLDWPDVAPSFGLKHYEVTYGAVVKLVSASTITLPADWLGSRTFTVKVVDERGLKSSGVQEVVTKLPPAPVTNVRAQVVDNTVQLSWDLPERTTLPISTTKLKRGETYAAAVDIGAKSGGFTTVSETFKGIYTYWLVVVDTDNVESTPVSATVQVDEPPGFVFSGKLASTLVGGTLTNAVIQDNAVYMPVKASETFEQHFTSNAWASPEAQVAAGFPLYVQPGNLTGSYRETFDFLTVLSSSRVTAGIDGNFIGGTGAPKVRLESSLDGVSWEDLGETTQAFASNFRFVRVTVSVSGDSLLIYRLAQFSVTLDAKLKDDAGRVNVVSTDVNGTVANFSKEFLDVTAINLTPFSSSSVSVTCVFQDQNLAGTYSVSSNVATVTLSGHGLVAGQNVRLGISSGTGVTGVYTVASVPNANSFTVAMPTANTSGNVLMYPQGFRAFVFNSTNGARASATLSWSVQGY